MTARRLWVLSVVGAAALMTVIDAALLQRSKSYFTGGFLSIDHLTGAFDTAAFVALSFAVDAAFIGLAGALIAWVLSRARVGPRASVAAGVVGATSALLVADVISYQILRYLGDAFDLGLMVDLTGGDVSEVLAVASGHLGGLALMVIGVAVAAFAVVWAANRYWAEGAVVPLPAGALLLPVALAIAGGALLTAAANASDTLENGLLRKPAGRAFAAVINQITDVDRDRFGAVGRSADPDPFDRSVFPYALDIPGNGIDENGVGGDFPAGPVVFDAPRVDPTEWQRRPDVILVVLESFRADVVGAKRHGKSVTPAMDAVAARGVSVPAAFSHNGYTVQSRHHLFAGSVLAKSGTTLIDDFLASGYRVGYVSAQDESFGAAAYDVGFERATFATDARADRARRFSTSTTAGSLVVPSTVVQERVGEFLAAHGDADAPLFLYVNFQETHFPYSRPGLDSLISPERLPRNRIEPGAREALWDTYLNTAANVDRAVGEVLDAVRRKRGAEPAIVITADHGESLFDEGFLGHGYALNDVQTRVPLIVANLPMQLEQPFGQADLRGAIDLAMRQPAAMTSRPAVVDAPGRTVFQYLGDVSRPRQIAFLHEGGRTVYDFRSRRVQIRGGPWSRPDDMSEGHRQMFTRLVRYWEAIGLAHGGPVEDAATPRPTAVDRALLDAER